MMLRYVVHSFDRVNVGFAPWTWNWASRQRSWVLARLYFASLCSVRRSCQCDPSGRAHWVFNGQKRDHASQPASGLL